MLTIAILVFLLALLGWLGLGIAEAPTATDYSAPYLALPAANFGASDIPNGTVAARYLAASDSSRALKSNKNSLGVVAPGYANYHMLGIVQARNGRVIKGGLEGELCVQGRCQARVWVPANTNLAAGTHLVPQSAWSSGDSKMVFGSGGTVAAPTNPGVLGPVVLGGVVYPAVNTFALLLEDLTATGSGAVQNAWVYVLPAHKPVVQLVSRGISGGNTADVLNMLLAPCLGVGIVRGLFAQLVTGGSAGSLAVNAAVNWMASSPVNNNVLSTAINIVNDGTDGAIAGLGADGAGDTDNGGLGTGGAAGTLAAEALREFGPGAMLSWSADYTSGTGQANLLVTAALEYF